MFQDIKRGKMKKSLIFLCSVLALAFILASFFISADVYGIDQIRLNRLEFGHVLYAENIYTVPAEIYPGANAVLKFDIVNTAQGGGYAEATISSTDISGYDYLTAWVYATTSGNVVKLGFGEAAATEQEETVTIDAVNTWQKVYWDLSDIAATSRNGVTKLRITNSNKRVYFYYKKKTARLVL